METTPATAAPHVEGAAPQSENTGTPPTDQSTPPSTPAPSKADKKLVEKLAKTEDKLKAVTAERDEYQRENAEMKLKLEGAAGTEPPVAATTAEAEPVKLSQEDEVKEVLTRNGLKKAWLLPDGNPCFSEAHARHVAGAEGFDKLTVISVEQPAAA